MRVAPPRPSYASMAKAFLNHDVTELARKLASADAARGHEIMGLVQVVSELKSGPDARYKKEEWRASKIGISTMISTNVCEKNL